MKTADIVISNKIGNTNPRPSKGFRDLECFSLIRNDYKRNLKKAFLSSLALTSLLMGASDTNTVFTPDIIVDDFSEPLNGSVQIFSDPETGISSASSFDVELNSVIGGTRETTLTLFYHCPIVIDRLRGSILLLARV